MISTRPSHLLGTALSLALAALPLVLGVLTSGCTSEIIDPAVEIPEKRSVVIVPFEDQGQNGFLSDRGARLSLLVAEALKQSKAEFRLVPKEKILRLYDADQDPRQLTAAQVAAKTGADYVLMGAILRWSLQEPNTYGIKKANGSVEVTLYETADAANERLGNEKKKDDEPGSANLPIAHRRVTAFFPHEYGMPDGTDEIDMTDEKMDAGLQSRMAQEIAWLLVGHTKDEEHLANGK